MIEFYYKYFDKSYKSKINQLTIDLARLFQLEGVDSLKNDKIILDEKYKSKLSDKEWLELNNFYNTLYTNEEKLSSVLQKFINKKNSNKNAEYKFIDTFAGCGGLSLGLEKAGFKPLYVNEIEARYLESYYFNHNLSLDNYYCGDIKDLTKPEFTEKYKNIDLVVGGPPCQGFSMANRQRVIDDPRNKLYKYYLELLKNVRPKLFLMENVKGMMNKSSEILEDIQNTLGEDYTIDIILLNAKDFGVPQNRERVFVIGSRLENIAAKTITSNIYSQKVKKGFSLGNAINDLPKLQPKREKNTKGIESNEIGYKFRKADLENTVFKQFLNQNKTDYLFNHTNRFNNDRDIEIFSRLPQGANSLHDSIKDIMPYSSRNHIFKDKYFKLKESEVCKTITSHMKMDCNMYIHPNQARGLSPREAARVQTFPDDFIFTGANNNWYAQIGNAVPVKLAEMIGLELIKYLK
jgi:DNA (cytosine-5)-methyltransferase 1